MRHARRKLYALMITAIATAACAEDGAGRSVGDEQSGSHSRDQKSADGPSRTTTSGVKQVCRTTGERNVEASEQLSSGYAPQQVLDFVTGEREGTLTWLQQDAAYGPESGTGSLRVAISRASSPLKYTEREGVSDLVAADSCPDELTVPVEVRVNSAGGALDEVFTGSAIAPGPGAAQVTLRIAANELAGTFALVRPAQGARLAQLELQLAFAPAATEVELYAIVETELSEDVGSTSRVQVAASTLAVAPSQ